MPNTRARIDQEHGPLIAVVLHPETTRPNTDPIEGWALLDTGAKHSGVHARCASYALGWQVRGAVELFTPGSTSEAVPMYGGTFAFSGEGALLHMDLIGVTLGYRASDKEVLMILGRDFLQDKVLAYDGRKGEWTLHW